MLRCSWPEKQVILPLVGPILAREKVRTKQFICMHALS